MLTSRAVAPLNMVLIGVLLAVASSCDGCGNTQLSNTIPLLTPSSSQLEFGVVFLGNHKDRPLTLQSDGDGKVHVQSTRITGDAAFSVSAVRDVTVAPRETLLLTVTFTPGEVGNFTAELLIENDSRNAPQLRIILTGTGAALPPCDDGNPCTEDSVNAANGTCLHANVDGPCSLGSLCVHDEQCVDGRCLGAALDCDDENVCTRNLCDANTGCVFIPDLLRCDDGNTCTVDSCDPVNDCRHQVLPDDAPCTDGNLCSLRDRCLGGVCHTEPAPEDPVPVGVLYGYGGVNPNGGVQPAATVLPDDRIVFWDQLNAPAGYLTRIAVAVRTGTQLHLQRVTEFPDLGFARTTVTQDGVIAAMTYGPGETQLRLVTVDGAGEAHLAASVELPGNFYFPVHFQNHVYVLVAGHAPAGAPDPPDILHVYDTANPAAPVETTTVEIPGWSGGMAVDDVNRVLMVAGGWGLKRFSLADPSVPVLLEPWPAGATAQQVSTDGAITVVRGTGQLLLDAATGTVMATQPNENTGVFQQTPGRLWVLVGDLLRVFDLTDPTTTAPAATVVLPYAVGSRELAVGGGSGKVVTVGPLVFLLEEEPVRLVPVSGPGHGTLGTLFEASGLLVTTSADSAHQLDLTNPQAPRFLAGHVFPEAAQMVSYTSQLRTPTVFTASAGRTHDPAVIDLGHRFDGPLAWLDASDLAAPQLLGSAQFPFPNPACEPPCGLNPRYVRSDGRRMLMATNNNDNNAIFLSLINPDNAPGSGVAELTSSTLLTIPAPGPLRWGANYIANDELTHHVAVSALLADNTSLVAIVNVSEPDSFQVLASGVVPFVLHGLALAGNAVAALGPGGPAFGETQAHLYRWEANAAEPLVETAIIPLVFASHFLLMDTHVLLISTRTGVSYVNMGTTPPRLMGSATLPEVSPISALVHGENLLLSLPGEVLVLSPPCPHVP